jgi:hypothetical protein
MPLPECKGYGLHGQRGQTAEKGHQPKMRGVALLIERSEQEDGTKVVTRNPRPVLFPRSLWPSLTKQTP